MNNLQIKSVLHQYINEADDRFIKLMYGMVEHDKIRTKIYSVKVNSISQKQYMISINKARKQYDDGNFITHEEFEKRFSK